MRSMDLHHHQGREDSISSNQSNLTIDSEGNLENEWMVWNKLVNNWPMYMKKKSTWIRVNQLEKNRFIQIEIELIGFNSFGCSCTFSSVIMAMFSQS